jgi:hypothetical protein
MTDEFDFSPTLRPRAAGAIGAYVALEIASGRPLFEALADDFVQDNLDEHPFLLDELAADAAVRVALAMGPEPVAPAVSLVAA